MGVGAFDAVGVLATDDQKAAIVLAGRDHRDHGDTGVGFLAGDAGLTIKGRDRVHDMDIRGQLTELEFGDGHDRVLEDFPKSVVMGLPDLPTTGPPEANHVDEVGILNEQIGNLVRVAVIPAIEKVRATASPVSNPVMPDLDFS